MTFQRRTRARPPVPSGRRAAALAVLAVPALTMGLAACGAGSPEPEPTAVSGTDETPHGYVEGADEATEPQLRLSAVDADGGGVTLVDLLTGDPVEAPGVGDGQDVLATSDGRFLFTTDGTDGTAVTVTDTGVWTVDHGDHSHYYRAAPSAVGTVDGDTSGHVVSNGSQVAMFFDGDGAVKVFPRQGLGDGELTEEVSFGVGAHHGVAVPFGDRVLTTVPGGDDRELPGDLALYDDGGEVPDGLTGVSACPEIHGAAGLRDHVAFACGDGVLTVDDDFTGTVTPYPQDADGRAWSLVVGRDLVAAPFEDGGLGVFDPESGEWRTADTGAPVVSVAVAPDDSTVLAVDEDGVGYVVDADSGEVTAQRQLVDGGGDTAPSVVLTRERGYVSDPAAGTVAELDVRDNLREARSIDVGGHPAAIAVTGGR
ncbi:hypothetical protein [Corynebacterium sp.]|jgi:hypothetical protein|uniref:hypothetical protein n=1 Tax=Corynebacterium sp. TaxID=1720 RepID=UPI0025B8BB2A|nr:hypothetical protein [Corynebacterium sp.]